MSLPAYHVDRAVPLLSDRLGPYLETAIKTATKRIWALMFLIEVRLFEDPERYARELLDAVSYAAWRGVDTRVIVSRTSAKEIEVANGTAGFYLAERGVSVRWFASPGLRSTHSKFVLVDDGLSIVGSHNWSDRGLRRSVEAAVAIESADLTSELADQFDAVWQASRTIEPD